MVFFGANFVEASMSKPLLMLLFFLTLLAALASAQTPGPQKCPKGYVNVYCKLKYTCEPAGSTCCANAVQGICGPGQYCTVCRGRGACVPRGKGCSDVSSDLLQRDRELWIVPNVRCQSDGLGEDGRGD